MDPFTLISTGMAVAGSVGKLVDGFQQRKLAMRKQMEAEVAPLPQNPYEKGIPQEDLEQRREDIQAMRSEMQDTLRQAGTRAVIGGLGKVAEAGIAGMAEIGAEAEQRMYRRDMDIAGREADYGDFEMAQKAAKISGASEDMAAARQDIYGAIGDLSQIGLGLGLGQEEQTATTTGSAGKQRKPFNQTKLGQTFKGETKLGAAIGSIFKKKS